MSSFRLISEIFRPRRELSRHSRIDSARSTAVALGMSDIVGFFQHSELSARLRQVLPELLSRIVYEICPDNLTLDSRLRTLILFPVASLHLCPPLCMMARPSTTTSPDSITIRSLST